MSELIFQNDTDSSNSSCDGGLFVGFVAAVALVSRLILLGDLCEMIAGLLNYYIFAILLLLLRINDLPTADRNAKKGKGVKDDDFSFLRKYKARKDGNHDFVYSDRPSVAGFWHIFAAKVYDGMPLFMNITREQKFVLESSGLMDELDILYYTTIGASGSTFRLPGHKMHHVYYAGERGFELPTLNLIHRFCVKNPNSKVLYFHNKGSGSFSPFTQRADIMGSVNRKANFRKALDCFTLNPQCIRQLDRFDTCGMRLSLVPAPHYTGNYWWARCSHINQLIPPKAAISNNTFLRMTSELNGRKKNQSDFSFHNDHLLGFGRYFAETWIGSLPAFSAADCMSAADNHHYVFGSGISTHLRHPRVCPSWSTYFEGFVNGYDMKKNKVASGEGFSNQMQPVPRLHFGLQCNASDMLYQPRAFRSSPAADSMIRKYTHLAPLLIKRSLLWYGQSPATYLNWVKSYLGDDPAIVSQKRTNRTVDQIKDDPSIVEHVKKIIEKHAEKA